MAQTDITISNAEYDQMMTVLDGIRAKLAPLKAPLTRMLSQPDGRAKLKALAQTDNGRLLREVYRAHEDLNAFFETIGWK